MQFGLPRTTGFGDGETKRLMKTHSSQIVGDDFAHASFVLKLKGWRTWSMC